ncbi:MAG: phosphoribosyltransferase [Pseudomonadales bacterium]
MTSAEKRFISEQDHMLDGFRLGVQVFDAGFAPTFIVGLWRGGSAVGIVVQECLAALGVATDHIALRTSYRGRTEYEQTVRDQSNIRVHGRQYLLENMTFDDRLLIVDDVFSSGRHTQAVIDSLQRGLKRNMPEQVQVASIWWRPTAPEAASKPDFYVHETSDWLVLPYEIEGLSKTEIAQHKPFIAPLLERCGIDLDRS